VPSLVTDPEDANASDSESSVPSLVTDDSDPWRDPLNDEAGGFVAPGPPRTVIRPFSDRPPTVRTDTASEPPDPSDASEEEEEEAAGSGAYNSHAERFRSMLRRSKNPSKARSELSWFNFWEYVQMRVEMECCSLRHRAEYLRRRSFPSAAAKREEILRDRAKDPHGMRKIVHQRAGMLDCAQRFLCARLDYQRLAEDFESETVREGMRLLSMTMNQSQSRMYHAYNGFDAALREFENRIPRDQIEARCHTIPPGGIRAVPGHEAWTAEETVCSICIAPVEEPGSVACLLDCRHAFHLDCVESWLHTNATCPNCRCAVGVATEGVEDEEEPSSDAEDAGGGSDAIPGGRNAASGAAARESLAEALGPYGPEVLDASEAFAVQMERFMDPDAEIPSDEERRMHDAMRFAYNQRFLYSDGEYEEEEEEE